MVDDNKQNVSISLEADLRNQIFPNPEIWSYTKELKLRYEIMTDWKNAEQVVYISCVDEVRYSFVSHLSDALRREGISVFIDNADQLSKEAKEKVERAKVSVMVLPGNRKVCLEKLDMVLACQMNNTDQVLVPVLYGDSPSKSEWLTSLDLKGLSSPHQSRKESSDSKLVQEVVRDVNEKLLCMGRVGIYSKLLEIENMVNKQPLGIRCVGIWGMAGIGKTTIAKAVVDKMCGGFDACCFIEDFDKAFRENRVYRLLVGQLMKDHPGNAGTSTKLSFKNKRVLLVLDNVHNPLVAESFLEGFDWFGPESLIIITSRNKQVFRLCRIKHIYEVQGLNKEEALQLFMMCASIKDIGEQNLYELVKKVIKYANGNPLALSIFGRELKGKKKQSEMETAVLKLELRPSFKIVDAVKSSYNTLSDSEKNIFLDIACFFNGENVNYVMALLDGCGFFPHVGIDVLVEKCLVTISENRICMHNMTQDVGREIVNGETVQIERRSRLWEPWSVKYLLEDNEHKEHGEPVTTFKRAQGTEEMEGVFLDESNLSCVFKPTAFENMLNLRLLKIYCSNPEIRPVINLPKSLIHSLPNELRLLHWENYPLQSLPQNFDPMHLVEINMPYSQLQKLWDGTKNLKMLRTIKLCHSQQLVDIDDLLRAQNLEEIDLQGCTRLQSFPATSQLLHLRVVNLSGCTQIKMLPDVPQNIEALHLQGTGIIALSIFKPNGGELVSLSEFHGLSDSLKLERLTSLMESSSSRQNLGKLNCLELKDCSHLQSLADMIDLDFLKILDLSGCTELETIQGLPRNLKELYLAGTAVREVPQLPQSLELLNAHGCVSLELIRSDPVQITMHYTFSNCFNLSPQVVNKFLAKARANVKCISRDREQEVNEAPAFSFCAPSHVNQNSALDLHLGSSVMVQLAPSSRSKLVGFAMLVEVSLLENYCDATGFGISCVCRWNNKEGHSHMLERTFPFWAPGEPIPKLQKDHIFVFCDLKMRLSTSEGNDLDILADLVVFEFFPVNKQRKHLDDSLTVTRCKVYVIDSATGTTNLKMNSPYSSLNSVEFSGNDSEEVLSASYDNLQKIDKALFLYIACLFNDEDVVLVAPLIPFIDLDISYGLNALADRSLIHVSSNGELVMNSLLRKMGKDILHSQPMLSGSSKDMTQDVASSSSYSFKYDVFPSFNGKDVRKTFLSHLHQVFKNKGITTFIDNEIDRGHLMSDLLVRGIKESRMSIVVLSKNYVSSRWNLNELIEIMNRKAEWGQILIPIFYDVDPSDVKKQRGEFGMRFKQTCENRTEDEKQQWCQALTDVGNIRGYHSVNWKNEAKMIEEIANDVLKKLDITPSNDFGVAKDHILKMNSLMCLESEEVRMVGIWGPPGIGKSTIARLLYSQLARHFRHSMFVDRAFVAKTIENSTRAKLDDYDTKLRLQAQFLSEILGQKQINVHHLGALKERLHEQKVLIILDDVDDQVLLDALARDTGWFGSGSRIIVTTRDKHLLKSYGITFTYEVPIPSNKQALQMFCQSAFRQNSPPDGFMELATKVVQLAGNLPFGLHVLSSSLWGKDKEDWVDMFPRLKDILEERLKILGDRHESGTELGKSLHSLSPFPMASYSSRNWRYDVFVSFCGQDVRGSFLSHFLVALKSKSIITFNDDELDKSQSIREQLFLAIRESRISIIVISKRYASSTWPLEELVEIAKCKKELTQKLIPIFYDVDPSDVRNQTGEFGMHFEEACYCKTEEEIQRWRQTLINIANLSGFYSPQWTSEADMIEKIVNDVLNTLSCTPSIDFHGLVGIEAHVAKINQLLCLESEEVKMFGIWGHLGIGKTTIARALYSELSSRFTLSAFLIMSSNDKSAHSDDNGAKLHFQELLLSNIFRQKEIITHLGMVQERLKDQKALIILDGVDDMLQLEALAGDTGWFGPGSRIIVTTRDKGLLKSQGIDDIYKVDLPSKKQALEMFCQFAFAQKKPPEGFAELAVEVLNLAGNLPLGLRILGSYLREQDKTMWTNILPQFKNNLPGEIEKILRVTYDGLNDHDKVMFLNIACLFNHDTVEYVTRLLADSKEDVVYGIKSLAEKSVIHITEHGNITMNHLQQNLGREIVRNEFIYEPGKRRYLVDSQDICHILEDSTGTQNVVGISMDISEIDELLISERGFSGMKNLQFLKFYTNLENKEVMKEINVHLPDGLDYLSRYLRLLHWEAFPMRSMPSTFLPENLVELTMESSKLEKLWDGVQMLGNLKCMNLRGSLELREIPDLSFATNLEKLDLGVCSSLTMLPSSIGNLHRLNDLNMEHCTCLEVLPTGVNLASLYCLILSGCSQLRSFPEISCNISDLYLDGTAIEEVPWWVENISGLSYLSMNGCKKLKKISPNISKLKFLLEVDFSECEALTEDSWQNHPEDISTSLMRVDMSGNSFERLPDTWTSIQPKDLIFTNCRKLVSLPQLPASLSMLMANNCESLESLCGSFHYLQTALQFINCFNLSLETRNLILQSDCVYAILPGSKVPTHFIYRAVGNLLAISKPHSSVSKNFPSFKACIVVEPRSGWFYFGVVWSFLGRNDNKYMSCLTNTTSMSEHLITFRCEFSGDEVSDVQFDFFCLGHKKERIKIIECGIQLLEVSPSLDASSQSSETEYGNDSGGSDTDAKRSSKRMRIT